MKLAQLFPVQNCMVNVYSLVESIFGANFVVYDAMGSMLTTAKNLKLLQSAQVLVDNQSLYDVRTLAYELGLLREKADVLVQSEYERSMWRYRQFAINADNNFSVMAGSLG